jgi:hypothetical protein
VSAECWALLAAVVLVPQAMIRVWFRFFPDWYVCERCGKVHEIVKR